MISLAVLAATACSSSEEPSASSAKPSPQRATATPIETTGVKEDTVCKATLTEAQQEAIGVWEAEPLSGEGEVSCYFTMTPDKDNAAGYVVSLFENEKALLQTADATDPSPTKAVPVTVKGRNAARQIMFGDDWRASLTVDIGAGQYLYVERYSPGHLVSEKDLNAQTRRVTEQVLGNLEKSSAEGA
ncbi:hypothetical protein ABZ202_28905 [Streptomyces sp. NPDC006186]|uniref:hypothetical protein n=1 Tax=Streptomyces sp. NPDC006186 TaxID=3155248 RepID=UPI0033B5739A